MFLLAAQVDNEDPEVTRAKFFIRDEFLVSDAPTCYTYVHASWPVKLVCLIVMHTFKNIQCK